MGPRTEPWNVPLLSDITSEFLPFYNQIFIINISMSVGNYLE